MTAPYTLTDPNVVPSPALLFYPALIRQNLHRAVEVAGSPDRLAAGSSRRTRSAKSSRCGWKWVFASTRCATLAEAAMLARCGTPDVLIAYPLSAQTPIGSPNCASDSPPRALPHWRTTRTPSALLCRSHRVSKQSVRRCSLDIDVGQHRTGVALSPAARQLYQLIADLPGLTPGGLHRCSHDGHNRQHGSGRAFGRDRSLLGPAIAFRADLERRGCAATRYWAARRRFRSMPGVRNPASNAHRGQWFCTI